MTEVGPPVPRSDFRLPRSRAMHRVLIISHTYIPPSNRGKLRALAARGLDVTVGVPQRWRDLVLGRTLEIAWERQNGVEVFPLPARHSGDAATLTFRGRALHALLRDKRPDLVQVEEEPTAPAARQVVRAARQLSLPAVLFTHQNVALPLPWLAGWRRNRTLRRLRGAIAGSEGAAALVREVVPGLRVGVIPQLGVHVPTEPEHAHHEGLARCSTSRMMGGRSGPWRSGRSCWVGLERSVAESSVSENGVAALGVTRDPATLLPATPHPATPHPATPHPATPHPATPHPA